MYTQIAHEVMHAISISQELDANRYQEPYFEDEALNEVGISFEAAVSHSLHISEFRSDYKF